MVVFKLDGGAKASLISDGRFELAIPTLGIVHWNFDWRRAANAISQLGDGKQNVDLRSGSIALEYDNGQLRYYGPGILLEAEVNDMWFPEYNPLDEGAFF